MITVFSSENCTYCTKAKALLKDEGLEFREVDIYDSREAAAEFVTRTNSAKTVPQILVNDTIVGGYDDLAAAINTHEFHQLIGDK